MKYFLVGLLTGGRMDVLEEIQAVGYLMKRLPVRELVRILRERRIVVHKYRSCLLKAAKAAP